MKSSLARPLENYFCLGLNLQMTALKKLASSTRKALKSFWGMIQTNSTARPHHTGLVAKNLRRARNCQTFCQAPGAAGASISQASDLCCQLETKTSSKIDLKWKYLNPKASVANLRQYAANTLPKNPAQPTSQPKTCPQKSKWQTRLLDQFGHRKKAGYKIV